MALSQVFIDESGTHDGSPCMCIGGLIFKKHKATEFSRRWRAILKAKHVPYFRMADVTHPQQGPFKGWPPEDLIDLEKKLINLLSKFAEMGFALSLNEKDFDEAVDKEFWEIPAPNVLGYAYTVCLRRALTAVGKWVQSSQFDGKISYFFEAGHMHQGNAHKILLQNFEARHPLSYFKLPLTYDYKYAAHAFVQKVDFPPLQGADLIAWLWRNSSMKLMERKKERRDMMALRNSLPLETFYMDKERLRSQNQRFLAISPDVMAKLLIMHRPNST